MYEIFKRVTDIIFSLLGLVILSPVFWVISILIKIESSGPVFFTQKRSGKDGVLFTIYKFRSMKSGTPDLSTDKLGDPDKYVTRIGQFIRKTSIDELPQLINILRGDMSFVGPRPALYNQYELIEERKKRGIHLLKPGLTGYAQVMGRDFISDAQKVVYDQYYFENKSLFLDIKIIMLTLTQVIKADGVKG